MCSLAAIFQVCATVPFLFGDRDSGQQNRHKVATESFSILVIFVT
jgi:hypothetical protein